MLQKAMKQGRNVHGIISLLDACSDHNITSRMCGHVGGYAYSVSVSKWLLDSLMSEEEQRLSAGNDSKSK